MRLQNNNFYFTIVKLLKEGKNPQKISTKLNISKQKLNYYLRKLKDKGIINKIGYATWEVKHDFEHALSSNPKQVRGHAFIWVVKLNNKIDWKSRLEQLKMPYRLNRGIIPRVIINNRKILLGKKSITVYESHSFYGDKATESRKYAVISLLETLGKIESKFQINLRPYIFRPTREHYGLIKNDLAQQCNRNKEKIYIRDDVEGEWLWIDDSFQLGELETGGKKAMARNVQLQNWWNDQKKHNFEVTPTFILNGFNEIQKTLTQLSEIYKNHQTKPEYTAQAHNLDNAVMERKGLDKTNDSTLGDFRPSYIG